MLWLAAREDDTATARRIALWRYRARIPRVRQEVAQDLRRAERVKAARGLCRTQYRLTAEARARLIAAWRLRAMEGQGGPSLHGVSRDLEESLEEERLEEERWRATQILSLIHI